MMTRSTHTPLRGRSFLCAAAPSCAVGQHWVIASGTIPRTEAGMRVKMTASCSSPSSSSPSWEHLLQQHNSIRNVIADRLREVEEELRRLDALRANLSAAPSSAGAVGRTVFFPSASAGSRGLKRSREQSDDGVAFFAVPGANIRSAKAPLADPFEFAGLFAVTGNPIAQLAPVQLSGDEVTLQQVQALFPMSCTTLKHRPKTLPTAAVTRIEQYLHDVGMAEGTAYKLSTCAGKVAYLRITECPDAAGMSGILSNAVKDKELQAARAQLLSDPGAFQACLSVALARSAVAEPCTPSQRRAAVALLAMPALFSVSSREIGETVAQCCRCDDRDVAQSTVVQWVQTLRCASPPHLRLPPPSQSDVFPGVCLVLISVLKMTAKMRIENMRRVLTACSDSAMRFEEEAAPTAREKASQSVRSLPSCERDE